MFVSIGRLAKISLLSAFLLLALSEASAQKMSLPATGSWNGFLHQSNVIECSNAGDSADIRVTIRNITGAVLQTLQVNLGARVTRHIMLDAALIKESYGVYNIDLVSGDGTKLSCQTVLYREAAAKSTEQFDYAFALPVEDPITGASAGAFNSYDPLGGTKPVFNWLSIVNVSDKLLSASVLLYNFDGTPDPEHSIQVTNLPPHGRRDIALGHDRGQTIGLYRILPTDSSLGYQAFITRYGQGNSSDSFAYAFPLRAQTPTCSLAPLPASTAADAYNWGELSNPGSAPATIQISVFDRSGQRLGEAKTVTIAPYAQYHFPLHEYLGPNNVGTLQVKCIGNQNGILAQSVLYGRTSSPSQLEWAYATQARAKTTLHQALALTSVNTFLGSYNWHKTFNGTAGARAVEFQTYAADGSLKNNSSSTIQSEGSWDFPLHEAAGRDFVGLSIGSIGDSTGELVGEVLRVLPKRDGSIGYIFNIGDRIVGDDIPPEAVDSDGDGMTDMWESAYGLNPHDASDARLDSDGDRLSNLEEYRRGRDPRFGDSSFSGHYDSLAPYLGTLAPDEIALLGKKFALNDDRLMTATAPADRAAIVSILMSDDFYSADLQNELRKFRDNPNNMSEFANGIAPHPIIPLTNQLQTSADIHAASETLFQHLGQSYNPTFNMLIWTGSDVVTYLMFKSRYENPLRGIMAHLWGGHFGTSLNATNSSERSMWSKMWVLDTMFGKGMGSFRDLIVGTAATQGCRAADHGIGAGLPGADGFICQFAPNEFLNNNVNTVTAPNENFAREFMELATMGPLDRWTRQPNYDQETVRAATAFLSGYNVNSLNQPGYPLYLSYSPSRHDSRSYTAFAGTPYQLSGPQTPAQFANWVLDHHPAVPRFIAGKLFSMLVYPDPPESIVSAAADKFKNEFDYDISKLVALYLNSEAMYSSRARNRNCVIEPYKMYMKIARGFRLPLFTTQAGLQISTLSRYYMFEWEAALSQAGEDVFNYPDVFAYNYCGRYPNDGVDGSSEWLDANKLLGRFNKMTLLLDRVEDYNPDLNALMRLQTAIPRSGAQLSPDDVVRYFQKMFDVELASDEYQKIRNYLITNPNGAPNPSNWAPTNPQYLKNKFAGLILIFSALPQGNME